MIQPRFIVRYFKSGESGLTFSSDTEIEVVGAITLGNLDVMVNYDKHIELITLLENSIDTLVYDQIKKDYPNYYLTPRFSPGYGDIPASENQKFLSLSSCSFVKSLSSGALFPTYSVVFALGLSKKKQQDHTKCELCKSKNCQFRRV